MIAVHRKVHLANFESNGERKEFHGVIIESVKSKTPTDESTHTRAQDTTPGTLKSMDSEEGRGGGHNSCM